MYRYNVGAPLKKTPHPSASPTPSPQGEGIFWWRFEAVPIRLLRLPGVGSADETVKLPLPVGAERIRAAPHWLPCVRGAGCEAA